MEQSYYNKIMELKRAGRLREARNVYLQYASEPNPEIDATYLDGFAKINILLGDYPLAKLALMEEYTKICAFKEEILDRVNNNEANTMTDSLILSYLEKAMRTFNVIKAVYGARFEPIQRNIGLNDYEIILSFTEDLDVLYFRYIFCLFCAGELGSLETEDYSSKVVENFKCNKQAILNVLQGIATNEEKVAFDTVYNNFIKEVTNKYMMILSVLPAFSRYLNS